MSLYRDRGIVLRTHKLGEADRIAVIMTRDHGKVRAVVKGVRKTKSRFGARLEPPSHADLLFYEGRELDIVTQAETVDMYPPLRDDFDRLGRALSMLEATDHVALDREPNPQLYTMLARALHTLATREAPLVAPAFFLKLLALEGFRPQVEGCVVCGEPDGLGSWAVEEGGLRCAAHRQGSAITPEAVAVLQRILGGNLGDALNEPLSPVTAEVDNLVVKALEHHLERRIRSIATMHRA
jgi:DNA repair protein RecO (recombination protein O)